MLSREQERAKFALEKVLAKRHDKQIKPLLVKLPARLHTNGLGQTVAFYLSSGPEVSEWLGEWLKNQVYNEACFRNAALINCITGAQLPPSHGQDLEAKYRQASQEARALALWLKRFAEAFIAGEEQ
jgi:CRISPR type III-B/RAMP module-associated protein Cmr5